MNKTGASVHSVPMLAGARSGRMTRQVTESEGRVLFAPIQEEIYSGRGDVSCVPEGVAGELPASFVRTPQGPAVVVLFPHMSAVALARLPGLHPSQCSRITRWEVPGKPPNQRELEYNTEQRIVEERTDTLAQGRHVLYEMTPFILEHLKRAQVPFTYLRPEYDHLGCFVNNPSEDRCPRGLQDYLYQREMVMWEPRSLPLPYRYVQVYVFPDCYAYSVAGTRHSPVSSDHKPEAEDFVRLSHLYD
ncbi:uncharacterized protein B0I36DRAFT_316264 [Microdochium trichocladiopsis]|uniref:Uncharacterized protein n=1 Tax=Microdochium trichocladiopsis TaxID=1682393 RepID=A0A9P9BV98_9PEZI|nr:uncharacterized protein B0I36DRAFT_343394 [Microdochium trichocladiopsis]XP_046017562.1 uncharacterized protein B0I36DRAFT_316264 [Microdochium trichocladiopsis]KAH7007829.1 hypothetical protein B0I36DRAFT_343394 [Microdochium trichocladiopsis]KAH7038441.1 hypothetical protein B0I36DRAFT_316264 [Microdochium trichocladiopsis]